MAQLLRVLSVQVFGSVLGSSHGCGKIIWHVKVISFAKLGTVSLIALNCLQNIVLSSKQCIVFEIMNCLQTALKVVLKTIQSIGLLKWIRSTFVRREHPAKGYCGKRRRQSEVCCSNALCCRSRNKYVENIAEHFGCIPFTTCRPDLSRRPSPWQHFIWP